MHDWKPILIRWAKKEGVDVVGRWLWAYPYQDISWYRQLLRHMTLAEVRKETKRRKSAMKKYREKRTQYIKAKRQLLEVITDKLLTALLASL